MSSPVLDMWALELQQFDINFQHTKGKKNVVVDVISRIRILGLYQDNGVLLMLEGVVKNIIEEVQSMDTLPKIPGYNMGNHNLDVLKKEQQWENFCKTKVKEMKKKLDPNFILDENNILRKVVKLKYTLGPMIVIPCKLTSLYCRVP